MKINSGGTGGELLTDFICANSIWKSIPPREGRVKILSSNLMPAHLFSSPVKMKKEKGKMLGLELRAGRWFCVKYQHPQHQNTGNRWNGSSFIPRPESELRHLVRRRDGAGAKPSESGKAEFHGALDQGLTYKAKRDFPLIVFPSFKLAMSLCL